MSASSTPPSYVTSFMNGSLKQSKRCQKQLQKSLIKNKKIVSLMEILLYSKITNPTKSSLRRRGRLAQRENVGFIRILSSSDCGSKHAVRQVFFMRNLFHKCRTLRLWKKLEYLATSNPTLQNDCCQTRNLWAKGNEARTNWPSDFEEGVRYPTTQLYSNQTLPAGK